MITGESSGETSPCLVSAQLAVGARSAFRIGRPVTFMEGMIAVAAPAVGLRHRLAVAVGRRRLRRVVEAGETTTVGELVEMLGERLGVAVWVDGVARSAGCRLGDAGVGEGSTVDWLPPPLVEARPVGGGRAAVVAVHCVAGPAAGAVTALRPGRHVLGRGTAADVRVADPDLDHHAALLDVGADGSVAVTQLTGRTTATIDAVPFGAAARARAGQVLHVASSRLELIAPPDDELAAAEAAAAVDVQCGASTHSPWRRLWERAAWISPAELAGPSASSALAAAHGPNDRVWARRADHADAFSVTIGWGASADEQQAMPAIDDDWGASSVSPVDVPVTTSIGPGSALVVAGDDGDADAVVRSMLVQVAVDLGPADWRLVVACDRAEPWEWCRWLPHLAGFGAAGDEAALVAAAEQCGAGHLIVVGDRPTTVDVAARRTTTTGVPTVATVTIAEAVGGGRDRRATLQIGSRFRSRWSSGAQSGPGRPVHAAGVAAIAALDVALALAPLEDPEAADVVRACLPAAVSTAELVAAGGSSPGAGLAVPVGWARRVVRLDLRAGRSPTPCSVVVRGAAVAVDQFLASTVLGLAAGRSAEQLAVATISSAPDSALAALVDRLPHGAGATTVVDAPSGRRALSGLQAEVRRRLRTTGGEREQRLVVIVSDVAAIDEAAPGLVALLEGAAARRPGGVHLLLGTSGSDCRSRVDGAVVDVADHHLASVCVDGAVEHFRFAPPDPSVADESAHASAVPRRATAAAGRHLWREPLPDSLPSAAVETMTGAVGIVDLPDEQRHAPLVWGPRDGHLVLLGDRGSGTSSTLVALVGAVCAGRRLDEMQCFVVCDRRGSPAAALAALPHVAAVVFADETDRLRRLGARLAAEVTERRQVDELELAAFADIVVAVDGERGGAVDVLHRVLADGPSVGIHAVVAAHPDRRWTTLIGGCPQRWLFHLADPGDAVLAGAATGDVPPAVAGRCCDLSRRRFAQVVAPTTVVAPQSTPPGVAPPGLDG